MNSSQISKETESLTITSKTLRPKIMIKPKLNANFFSIATCTNTSKDKPKYENLKYRKTISYLRSPSFVDLVKQTNLAENKTIKFEKNYVINLIKMRLKKDKTKLPTIQGFKTISPKTDINFRTFSIELNDKNNYRYQFQKTFNFSNRKKNKEKIDELYKKVYNNHKNNNLKSVYVKQFINGNINNNKSIPEGKETINVKTKQMIDNDINHNFIVSKKRFMKYHGFNKRNKFIYKIKLYDKKKDKYQNINNIQIWQLFLKKKLKILNKDVSIVKDECDIAKKDLISVYDGFNKEIQKNIDEAYRNEEEL